MSSDTLVMIMAGGKGSRLGPLTCHRAKPAVPFGGRYRIIDFVLSNLVNSGYRRVYVLTQYMASSLIKHLNQNWRMSAIEGFIEMVPAQMRTGDHWYQGTADSVYQNLNLIRDNGSEHVAVFGGDHIYKFAVDQMEEVHRENDADLTVAAWPVPREEAHQFGVIHTDARGRITGFQEKPHDPAPMPGRPSHSLVSMGNYFFRSRVLQQALTQNDRTGHDFGKDIIPKLVRDGAMVQIYDFASNKIPGEPEGATPYWRDVGTLDSYFQANFDLRSPLPMLNVYNRSWRLRTAQRDFPPARFVRHHGGQAVDIVDSLVCEGSIVQSAVLHETMLGYDCIVRARSMVVDSVLMAGCEVGEEARVRAALIDKNCSIAANARIGIDAAEDRARFPFITESGLVVLPKGTHVPADGPVEFAFDIAELLETDPATREDMAKFAGKYTVSSDLRHSDRSAGPTYQGRTHPH